MDGMPRSGVLAAADRVSHVVMRLSLVGALVLCMDSVYEAGLLSIASGQMKTNDGNH
jgi:hypothetical protein